MNYPKVSIIILNWNGLKYTIKCLESLRKITYPNYEVIIIDNGSSGNDPDVLEERYKDYIRVIRNKENLGFAGGNNVGIRRVLEEGKSSYVLLLNNDTTVEPNFLDELIKTGKEDEKTGVVGGKIHYYDKPDKIWYGGGRINLLTSRTPHEVEDFFEVKSVNFITGCLMLIKTKVFKEVGLLNEDYFLTVEDWDFSYRVKEKYNIKITPHAIIYHKVSVSTGGEKSPFNMYYCHRNRWIFINKNIKDPFKKSISIVFYFLSFLKALFLQMFHKRVEGNMAIINGTIDAFRGKYGKRK